MDRRLFLLAGSAALMAPSPSFGQERATSFDVVVIGAGGAGLSAAITAKDAGASVLVLEKMPIIGGNTQLAAGGMNAAGTRLQTAKGIKDDWRIMYEDALAGGRDRNQRDLVEVMTKGSSDAIEWLSGLGANLTEIVRSGGGRVERTHQPAGGFNFGPYITRVLLDNTVARQVPVRRDSRVLELLRNGEGGVHGLVVQDRRGARYTVQARAVVIASGGYGSSPEKMQKYRPPYAAFTSTGQPGTTGDALEFAGAIGAELFDLDQIQIHPTQAVGAKTLISETVRGAGAIMVNREGRRFVNELTTRDKGSAAVLEQTGKTAFVVFDDSIKSSMKLMEGYFHLDLVKQGDTLAALGQHSDIDGGTLAGTVETYNRYQSAKQDTDFGRDDMARSLTKPPFYAIEVKPGIHFTMGGIRINPRTQVMSRDQRAIPGLFAAGEVTGGVHGANRLGGNSMTALFTFGPIAGREAAAFAKG